MVELRDELLFKQPETSHLGDCPICFLPQPLDHTKSYLETCCSKLVCNGCHYANLSIHEDDDVMRDCCPFCRQIRPDSEAELEQNKMRRVEVNDPIALREMGKTVYREGDYSSVLQYLTKSAELGDVDSHYLLSTMYQKGEGVQNPNPKELYHMEEAAVDGHPTARYNLGAIEWGNKRFERAVKHFTIAANLGFDGSLETLKEIYPVGYISKEDYADALRGHQAAVDATKSPQREAAEAAKKRGELTFS